MERSPFLLMQVPYNTITHFYSAHVQGSWRFTNYGINYLIFIIIIIIVQG